MDEANGELKRLKEDCKKDDLTLRAVTAHRNDITTLQPSDSWIASIDESYLGKGEAMGEKSDFVGKGPGLIGGVVFSADNPLPKLPRLHCAEPGREKSLKELAQEEMALKTILNHANCGVLALPAAAQEMSLGYTDLLIAWVDVLVRLLPFPDGDGKVKVHCLVEQGGSYKRSVEFEPVKAVCLKTLKDTFPERALRLELSFESVQKGHPYNFYADLVAHTCQHFGKVAQRRYGETQWGGVCYLNGDPTKVSAWLKCLYRSVALDGETWTELMRGSRHGLTGALAARFGERAKSAAAEWEAYLAFFDDYRKSGKVDMALLRREQAWLEQWYPGAGVSARSRLVWLTGCLSVANHKGKLMRDWAAETRAEFNRLSAELYDEYAPLVCDATLNYAVAYTNAYEFEMALAVLQNLLGKEKALVGTSNRGKLLSSAGQHLAFLGDADGAIAKFGEAISCFEQLSDGDEKTINLDITRAYLATATMDGHPERALEALGGYLLPGGDARPEHLADEAVRLSATKSGPFRHHVLLRYIAQAESQDPLRKAYRQARSGWCSPGTGHPWELIEFYRGLLSSEEVRLAHFKTAYEIALSEGGATVKVIAAVIAGAALTVGRDVPTWKKRLEDLLPELDQIPGLKEGCRYQTLVDQPTAKLGGLELAAKVLPFNFR